MSQAAPAPHQVTVEVGGRTLTLETGKAAKQANGAVLARYGDTVVLVTACMDNKKNDRDFSPSRWTTGNIRILREDSRRLFQA